MFLAPVPRLPKFIFPNRAGLSCTRRVGEGTTLPWDSRASPQAASSRPGAPDLLRLPTRSLPSSPPHRGASTRVPRPGTGDSARGQRHTHRPDGDWDWGGEGELCFQGTAETATAQKADPAAADEVGRGGALETGEGLGEKRATRRRQEPPPTSVDAGRCSPVGRKKLTK